jgi:hypothetical protein
MNIAAGEFNRLSKHANCIAASVRDSLRTAQFYARDLSGADGSRSELPHKSTALSSTVAVLAHQIDNGLTKAADVSVKLLSPRWRNLPSPFDGPTRTNVLSGIASANPGLAPEFTSYFFRSARSILAQWTQGHSLVLEHRIESVRRTLIPAALAPAEPTSMLVAQILVALVVARPIAKHGPARRDVSFFDAVDANVTVMSAACLALLLANAGRPSPGLDESAFLAIAGHLLAPKLPAIRDAIVANDVAAVSQLLDAVAASY